MITAASAFMRRRVEEQTNTPFYRGRGSNMGQDKDVGPTEWGPYKPQDDPFEKKQGWAPPGRGSEWQRPRRDEGDEDDPRPGRGGRGGGMGGGGLGGGFGGQPLKR